MVLAEVSGEVVGYARGWWVKESPSIYLYKHNAFLLPAWRRKGIGRAMLEWIEARLKAIAGTHPHEAQKYFQVSLSQSQQGAAILLARTGYQPIRYFYQMLRPNLDEIPKFPLPEGLDIRPVTADHYQAIWDSIHESTREEWGSGQPTEDAFQEWRNHPHFQPHLWQIAWDMTENKVAGTVLTYISHEENKQFNRKRGYTEGVGVSRPWRRRGLARALIARSLQDQKTAGMTESALVADSQSAFGLTRLYEICGFQIMGRDTIYRKPL
jgi:GNAT superfamily N-acetyltransferase